MIRGERVPFVFLGMLCLLTGLWTGLSRIGWGVYVIPSVAHHGAVMVGGFLGTLISLEKVIPLKKKALFSIPLCSALSALAFSVNSPRIALTLLMVSSAGLSLVFIFYFIQNRGLIYALMVVGALCWLGGNVLLTTSMFYPLAFPWWIGFPLFVITAERLELARYLPVSKGARYVLVLCLALFAIGCFFSFHGIGNILLGAALAMISIWLLRFDVVGISIRKSGLTQFVAIALTCGYFALLLDGVLFVVLKGHAFGYDAIVHTFFIGFVFSMIFAHGPIILPGVLGIFAKPFHKIFYLWLALLELSWITRVAGDISLNTTWRMASAALTTVALIGYFASLKIITVRTAHAKAV